MSDKNSFRSQNLETRMGGGVEEVVVTTTPSDIFSYIHPSVNIIHCQLIERQNVASIYIQFSTSDAIANWTEIFRFKRNIRRNEVMFNTNISPSTLYWTANVIRSVGVINASNILAYGIGIV